MDEGLDGGVRWDPERIRRWKVSVALAGLYFIWGSTYLAIRFAIESLPPFLMAGVRFLIAGGILYGWARARGAGKPGGGLWRTAAISGALMLACGNGAVVWAEQFVPSGMVSLLVATVPLWIVLQDWGWGRGGAPGAGVMFGIFWGLVGVGLLVTGSEIGRAGPQDLLGGLLVLGGTCTWAAGSLVARYGARPQSASLGNGMQMLVGGSILLLAGILRGEVASVSPGMISWGSVLALAYLIVFGSLVAFSSYIWLLGNTTPAVASTYAYVNPVVALLLGWALAEEPLSARTILAAFVILSAVMIITTRRSKGGPPARARG
jgi:drug/metabolite transporter (DMT)-like permease